MSDYSQAKIYKITDINNIGEPIGDTECYYGSQVEPLYKRMSSHISGYNRFKKGKMGTVMSFILFDKYGVNNCIAYRLTDIIELIEEVECKTKEELLKREGWYMLNNVCINKCITGGISTDKYYFKEYQKTNKEKLKEYQKKYNEANKEKKSEKGKEKYKCICGSEIRKDSKSEHEKTKKHLNFINK